MTEQLMDDLTNEEHEALLLMSEHGIAAPLSPAAQAVLDAVEDDCIHPSDKHRLAAAALRAAADQFNSVEAMPGALFCRNKLFAIANELEQING
jgi:hypothetical protein